MLTRKNARFPAASFVAYSLLKISMQGFGICSLKVCCPIARSYTGTRLQLLLRRDGPTNNRSGNRVILVVDGVTSPREVSNVHEAKDHRHEYFERRNLLREREADSLSRNGASLVMESRLSRKKMASRAGRTSSRPLVRENRQDAMVLFHNGTKSRQKDSMLWGHVPVDWDVPFLLSGSKWERTSGYDQASLFLDCVDWNSSFADGIRDHGFVHNSLL